MKTLGILILLVAGAIVPSASAAPPITFDEDVTFSEVDGPGPEACTFPVLFEQKGAFHYSVHFSNGPDPWGYTRHADFTRTYTNILTGASVTTKVVRSGNSIFDTEGTVDPVDGTITVTDAFHGMYLLEVVPGVGKVEGPYSGSWESFFTFTLDGELVTKGFAKEPNGYPGVGYLVHPAVCALIG